MNFSFRADTLWLAIPGDTLKVGIDLADGAWSPEPQLTWRVLESGVASVSAAGVVTAQAPGQTRVVAEGPGAADTLVVKVAKYVSLSVGAFHTCAVTADGALHCWGNNIGAARVFGRELPASCNVGGTRFTCAPVPVRIWNVPPMARAFTGWANTCAVTPAGHAWCWGANGHGTAGTSTSTGTLPPAPLLGGLQVETMSMNGFQNCLLTPEGAAHCWGLGVFSPQPAEGELRFLSYVTNSVRCGIQRGSTSITCFNGNPPPELSDHAWKQVIANWGYYDDFCALDVAGRAWCWGLSRAAPEKVSGDVPLERITRGRPHGCGLTAAGQAYCWGWNAEGQLGRGSTAGELPVDSVAGGHRFTDIGAGERHTCGLTVEGTVYCWGTGEMGEVGDGARAIRRIPFRVSPSRFPV